MIPVGGQINTQNTEATDQPSRTWKLDFERGRVTGITDGLEAVRQAVSKIIQTERFRYFIYSFDYGIELKFLIGQSPAIVRSELRRRIVEALQQDDRIQDVTDFDITINGDTATVRFTVVSSFGSFQQEVVMHV
jgi:hypothetical protein